MDSQIALSPVVEIKDIPSREALLELLSRELVVVTFNKLNGDERKMTCTLIAEHLPAATRDDPLSQTKIRNLEEKNIVVWDTNAASWRSFRYDRVSNVEVAIQIE